MYASCQAKIFDYLFKISFEAPRELSLNGHRKLDSDLEVRAAAQLRQHLRSQPVPDLRRYVTGNSKSPCSRRRRRFWFWLRAGPWNRLAVPSDRRVFGSRSRLRFSPPFLHGFQRIGLCLQEKEYSRFKGHLVNPERFIEPYTLIRAVGFLA